MSNTDFFDDDLIKPRDKPRGIPVSPTGEDGGGPPPSDSGVSGHGVTEFNLAHMARHKHEVNEQVAHVKEELERLKDRQATVEREKRELEDLRRKEEDYERGKGEMLEKLKQGALRMEKQELASARLVDLATHARQRFKVLQQELEALQEADWEEATLRESLTDALARIDDARLEYNKTMARLETASPAAAEAPALPVASPAGRLDSTAEGGRSFREWLTIGWALSAPLVAVLVILFAVHLALRMLGLL